MIARAQFTIHDANDIITSSVQPISPIADSLWLDTGVEPNQLKRWNGINWVVVNDTTAIQGQIGEAQEAANNAIEVAKAAASEVGSLVSRVSSAEEKITSDAIVNTVRSSSLYQVDVNGGRNYVLNSSTVATFIDNLYRYQNGTQSSYTNVYMSLANGLFDTSNGGDGLYISFDIKRTSVVSTNTASYYSGVWISYTYLDAEGNTQTTSRGYYLRTTDSDFVSTDSDWVRVRKGPLILTALSPTGFTRFTYGTSSASGTTGTVQFKNVKVEVGAFTGWTPAPEDLGGITDRLVTAESEISQLDHQISLKVSTSTYNAEKVYRGDSAPGSPSDGTLWLDTSSSPELLKRYYFDGWNPGEWTVVGTQEVKTSGVYIGPDEIRLSAPNTVIEVPGEGEQLRIDSDGVSAKFINSPSVVARYTGRSMVIVNPGATPDGVMTFNSLADVFALLTNKFFSSVSVYLMGGASITIGDLALNNAWGRVSIANMSSAALIGTLSFSRCNQINLADIILRANSADREDAIEVIECQTFNCSSCMITGSGTNGIRIGDRILATIQDTEVQGFTDAINIGNACVLHTSNIRGTGYIRPKGAVLMAYGTLPSGGIFSQSNSLVISSGSSTSGGSGTPPATPTITTVTFNAITTRTYRGGSWASASGLLQGYTSGNGHHYACVWFDNTTLRSSLLGKTIVSATLSLRRIGGYGRGSEANVYLHGLTNSGASGTPSRSGDYGMIGSVEPTNVMTFSIPIGIVTALRSGSIQGFCLYTGETSTISGEAYSRHYAAFTAIGGESIPVLTVVYQ